VGDANARVDNQHRDYEVRDGGIEGQRRDWRLVAAGVVLLLVVLAVTGRLQRWGPGAGGVGPSAPAAATAPPGSSSGLSLAGRVRLPGQPAAVAAGEGAVWVLLAGNRLLRVDPERHRVTGSVDLAPPGEGGFGIPLIVGEGAVWVRAREGTEVTLRIDPVSLRETARFDGHAVAAGSGALWSYCCRRGSEFLGLGRTDARTLHPGTPLRLADADGRRQPVGRFAVGEGAVWVQGAQDQRVWRVPLAAGQPRGVPAPGVPYGLAADAGAAWVLSGRAGSDGSQPELSGRLLRLDPSTGRVTAATPLPQLVANLAVGPVVGAGAVWLVGSYSQLRQGGSILLRVDRASGRVVGWYRSTLPWHLLLAAGSQGAWVVTGAAELLHVVPA
jgi:streptogramin lyase